MAKRERTLRPGEAQLRRAGFCLRLLGWVFLVGVLAAIVVGIPFPGVWQALFVPILAVVPFVLVGFILIFFLRSLWFRLKARHYAAVVHMNSGR